MNSTENFKNQFRNRNLANFDIYKGNLQKQREAVEKVKQVFLISDQNLKDVLENDLGKKFNKFNTKVLSEIEKWILADNEIYSFFDDYESKQLSLLRIPHFFSTLAKLKYIERKFGKFEIEGKRINEEIKRFKDSIYLKNEKNSTIIQSLPTNPWLKFVNIFFSPRNVKEIFIPIIGDWHEEYFEALSKNKHDSIFWINMRNRYAFIRTILQMSPVGDLIEFIIKIAKP